MNRILGDDMPGGDRTGPRGRGRKTGRGLGYCAGHGSPGWTQVRPFYGRGRGRGQGRGGGFGWNRGRGRRGGRGRGREPSPDDYPYHEEPHVYEKRPYYYEGDMDPYDRSDETVMTPEEERRYLKGYLKDIETEAAEVKRRIELLKNKK